MRGSRLKPRKHSLCSTTTKGQIIPTRRKCDFPISLIDANLVWLQNCESTSWLDMLISFDIYHVLLWWSNSLVNEAMSFIYHDQMHLNENVVSMLIGANGLYIDHFMGTYSNGLDDTGELPVCIIHCPYTMDDVLGDDRSKYLDWAAACVDARRRLDRIFRRVIGEQTVRFLASIGNLTIRKLSISTNVSDANEIPNIAMFCEFGGKPKELLDESVRRWLQSSTFDITLIERPFLFIGGFKYSEIVNYLKRWKIESTDDLVALWIKDLMPKLAMAMTNNTERMYPVEGKLHKCKVAHWISLSCFSIGHFGHIITDCSRV